MTNDLDIMQSIDKLPLNKVVCPALIIHGDSDNDVPPAQGKYAADTIADAELYRIDKGSHMGFWLADGAEDVQKYAVEWLQGKIC